MRRFNFLHPLGQFYFASKSPRTQTNFTQTQTLPKVWDWSAGFFGVLTWVLVLPCLEQRPEQGWWECKKNQKADIWRTAKCAPDIPANYFHFLWTSENSQNSRQQNLWSSRYFVCHLKISLHGKHVQLITYSQQNSNENTRHKWKQKTQMETQDTNRDTRHKWKHKTNTNTIFSKIQI